MGLPRGKAPRNDNVIKQTNPTGTTPAGFLSYQIFKVLKAVCYGVGAVGVGGKDEVSAVLFDVCDDIGARVGRGAVAAGYRAGVYLKGDVVSEQLIDSPLPCGDISRMGGIEERLALGELGYQVEVTDDITAGLFNNIGDGREIFFT